MNKKFIIFGAGPSGLSTAYGIKKNKIDAFVEVYEKQGQVGGLAGSIKSGKDFIDFGPHRLSVQNSRIKEISESLLGSNLLVKKSQHGVEFKDRLYQFPPKVLELINIKTITIIFQLACSYIYGKFHWFVNRYTTETFKEFVKHKFGNYFLEQIAEPMSTKVWGNCEKIDPNFVVQRFSIVKPLEIIKQFIIPSPKLNPSTFYYPEYGGFQAIWDSMAETIKKNKAEIHLKSYPVSLTLNGNEIVEMEIKQGEKIKKINTSDSVIVSTIPIISLLNIIDFKDQKLLDLAKEIRVRSMFLVVLKFNQNRTLPYRTLIFPEKKFIFNRIFEQNLYSRQTVEEGKSVIVADITFDKDIDYYNKDEVCRIVKEQISELKYINLDKLESISAKKIDYAYVSPELETRKNFDLIEKELSKINNLRLIGRFGAGEYDNSDYAILNGLDLGDLLTSKISSIDYDLIKSKTKQSKILG